jgi:2-keto-4-pentenoate hydratase
MDLADGAALVGYKIGATSEAIQKMFKIDHPDFGYLTDRMLLPEGACLDPDRFISPKVEAEVAFRVEADLSGESVTAGDVLEATAEVFPALEVLDSRFANWEIQLVDTVADKASSALAETDGSRQTARGSAVLGHPAESVAHLVRLLAPFGDGIRAGDIVLSGAWAAAVELSPGCAARASFDSIGTVCLRMSRNGGA